MTTIRTYQCLISLPTFEERFNYLKMSGSVGGRTFGGARYLNQAFYRSPEWRRVRRDVIIRDGACDLGIPEREIRGGKILVHHMIPITKEMIYERDLSLLDPEFLITVSQRTHDLLHYGADPLVAPEIIVRKPFDTCPWR